MFKLLKQFSQPLGDVSNFSDNWTRQLHRILALIEATTNDRINWQLAQKRQVVFRAKIGDISGRRFEYGRGDRALGARETRHILDNAQNLQIDLGTKL